MKVGLIFDLGLPQTFQKIDWAALSRKWISAVKLVLRLGGKKSIFSNFYCQICDEWKEAMVGEELNFKTASVCQKKKNCRPV